MQVSSITLKYFFNCILLQCFISTRWEQYCQQNATLQSNEKEDITYLNEFEESSCENHVCHSMTHTTNMGTVFRTNGIFHLPKTFINCQREDKHQCCQDLENRETCVNLRYEENTRSHERKPGKCILINSMEHVFIS